MVAWFNISGCVCETACNGYAAFSLVPTLRVGTHDRTLRVLGKQRRGASKIGIPTRSVGTRKFLKNWEGNGGVAGAQLATPQGFPLGRRKLRYQAPTIAACSIGSHLRNIG